MVGKNIIQLSIYLCTWGRVFDIPFGNKEKCQIVSASQPAVTRLMAPSAGLGTISLD